MARSDLLDQLEARLPWVDPAAEAHQILGVMARISGAARASAYFEQEGALRWLAGDRLPDDIAIAIKRAWRSQRRCVLTGTAFTELGAVVGETGPDPSWLMWIRRPVAGGLDAVYLAGTDLRPLDACAARLISVGALLTRLHRSGTGR